MADSSGWKLLHCSGLGEEAVVESSVGSEEEFEAAEPFAGSEEEFEVAASFAGFWAFGLGFPFLGLIHS